MGILGCMRLGKVFCSRHALRPVESLPAFSAAVRADREKQENPEFKEPATLRAVHVVAAANGANSLRLIDEEAQDTLHLFGELPFQSQGKQAQPAPVERDDSARRIPAQSSRAVRFAGSGASWE